MYATNANAFVHGQKDLHHLLCKKKQAIYPCFKAEQHILTHLTWPEKTLN